jgi:hypothetical protein
MKPRARRIALLTVAAGCLVVGALVGAHWSAVRDHVECWHFQLTRATVTDEPHPPERTGQYESGTFVRTHSLTEESFTRATLRTLLGELADFSGRPVIFEDSSEHLHLWLDVDDSIAGNPKRQLEVNGFRILEQRFPRRAYVVVGYPKAAPR